MKFVVAGSSGFIGSYLVNYFSQAAHELTLLSRNPLESPHKVSIWDPSRALLETEALEGQDIIINLSGANLADGRWTKETKREIVDSRIMSSTLLVRTLTSLANKPRLFVNSSAIGYYGNHPAGELVTENSPAGTGFLADLCVKWEQAVDPAEVAGIRVVKLRTGLVLGNGGALEKMLPPFKHGVGGKLGSGKQMMSWISLQEIGPILDHLIVTPSLSGAVNVTTPTPISNAEFTHALGNVLNKSVNFTVPTFALKLAFGEMAEETLLASSPVIPKKLLDNGYRFRFTDLREVLSSITANLD